MGGVKPLLISVITIIAAMRGVERLRAILMMLGVWARGATKPQLALQDATGALRVREWKRRQDLPDTTGIQQSKIAGYRYPRSEGCIQTMMSNIGA